MFLALICAAVLPAQITLIHGRLRGCHSDPIARKLFDVTDSESTKLIRDDQLVSDNYGN